MSAYRLDDIEAGHNGFSLRVDGWAVEPGCIVAVVGANGAGKTTLLNLLAFMARPRRGTVSFRAQPVDYADRRGLLALRRKIGYLMQNPCLFNMSVRANIEYGLRLRGAPGNVMRRRVARAMEELGLTELARRNARELSGGEVQLVALARTLVLETSVILLDEPMANVDSARIDTVERRLVDANRADGVTVIFTTHSEALAERIAHRRLHISADVAGACVSRDTAVYGQGRTEESGA